MIAYVVVPQEEPEAARLAPRHHPGHPGPRPHLGLHGLSGLVDRARGVGTPGERAAAWRPGGRDGVEGEQLLPDKPAESDLALLRLAPPAGRPGMPCSPTRPRSRTSTTDLPWVVSKCSNAGSGMTSEPLFLGGATMSTEVIYRPNRPIGPTGTPLGIDAAKSGTHYYHLVMQERAVVVAYNPVYFVTTSEVVADLLELMKSEQWQVRFVQFEDFVVWSHGRVLAVVHSPKDFEAAPVEDRVVLFNEVGNETPVARPWPGWPSRGEWIASGRGEIAWLDPHENPERGDHRS